MSSIKRREFVRKVAAANSMAALPASTFANILIPQKRTLSVALVGLG